MSEKLTVYNIRHIMKQHQGMTDRSARDGCACGDPDEFHAAGIIADILEHGCAHTWQTWKPRKGRNATGAFLTECITCGKIEGVHI